MKTIEYQILRYRPDIFTEEFVNIGVVVYDSEDEVIYHYFDSSSVRASHFFSYKNTNEIKSFINNIQLIFEEIAKKPIKTLFENKINVQIITSRVLPKDDSSFQFSDIKKELTLDSKTTAESLFNRLVLKHTKNTSNEHNMSDTQVWNKVYKEYFKKYNIDNIFTQGKFITKYDTFTFDHVWKNDIFHILAPLSLELKEEQSMKEKVYKWAGKTQELLDDKIEKHIYFLASTDAQEIREFVKAKLNNNKSTVYFQEEAELLANQFKQKVEKHNE